MHFYHPQIQLRCVEEVKKCDPCRRVGRGHGKTASREAPLLPWQDVAFELIICHRTLKIGDHKVKFVALTMIDMVTDLVELVGVHKTAAYVAHNSKIRGCPGIQAFERYA
jgi:hypothetical protein